MNVIARALSCVVFGIALSGAGDSFAQQSGTNLRVIEAKPGCGMWLNPAAPPPQMWSGECVDGLASGRGLFSQGYPGLVTFQAGRMVGVAVVGSTIDRQFRVFVSKTHAGGILTHTECDERGKAVPGPGAAPVLCEEALAVWGPEAFKRQAWENQKSLEAIAQTKPQSYTSDPRAFAGRTTEQLAADSQRKLDEIFAKGDAEIAQQAARNQKEGQASPTPSGLPGCTILRTGLGGDDRLEAREQFRSTVSAKDEASSSMEAYYKKLIADAMPYKGRNKKMDAIRHFNELALGSLPCLKREVGLQIPGIQTYAVPKPEVNRFKPGRGMSVDTYYDKEFVCSKGALAQAGLLKFNPTQPEDLARWDSYKFVSFLWGWSNGIPIASWEATLQYFQDRSAYMDPVIVAAADSRSIPKYEFFAKGMVDILNCHKRAGWPFARENAVPITSDGEMVSWNRVRLYR